MNDLKLALEELRSGIEELREENKRLRGSLEALRAHGMWVEKDNCLYEWTGDQDFLDIIDAALKGE